MLRFESFRTKASGRSLPETDAQQGIYHWLQHNCHRYATGSMQRCDSKATLPPRLKNFEPRDVADSGVGAANTPAAASSELKNKSTVRCRNTVENSFNSAVANNKSNKPAKSALNVKSTSADCDTNKQPAENKQQQAGLPRGSFRALDNDSPIVTVLGK
jgi:hypothetical protein